MTDFTEANREYFDKMATTYQEKFAQGMKVLAEQTSQHRMWISDRWTDSTNNPSEEIRMLEYACGPGVISMTLAPFLTQVIGVDISDKMVEEFNRNAATLGMSDKMAGHVADLLSDEIPDEFTKSPYVDLDILAVSMALHHFEHPDIALQQLGKRVKSGGTCFIIDLVLQPDNGHGHGHGHSHGKHEFGDAAHTIGTHGFSEDSMRSLFQQAGFDTGFKYQPISEPLVFNKDGRSFSKSIFIARAQRA